MTATGCHGVEVDPSNRFVFVPHVARSGGPNGVAQFLFDGATGRLTPNEEPFLHLDGNQGPRHLLVHPRYPWPTRRTSRDAAPRGNRPDTATGTLADSDHLHGARRLQAADGDHLLGASVQPGRPILFVVTREHNSITSFAIDGTSGRLTVKRAACRPNRTPGPCASILTAVSH